MLGSARLVLVGPGSRRAAPSPYRNAGCSLDFATASAAASRIGGSAETSDNLFFSDLTFARVELSGVFQFPPNSNFGLSAYEPAARCGKLGAQLLDQNSDLWSGSSDAAATRDAIGASRGVTSGGLSLEHRGEQPAALCSHPLAVEARPPIASATRTEGVLVPPFNATDTYTPPHTVPKNFYHSFIAGHYRPSSFPAAISSARWSVSRPSWPGRCASSTGWQGERSGSGRAPEKSGSSTGTGIDCRLGGNQELLPDQFPSYGLVTAATSSTLPTTTMAGYSVAVMIDAGRRCARGAHTLGTGRRGRGLDEQQLRRPPKRRCPTALGPAAGRLASSMVSVEAPGVGHEAQCTKGCRSG